MDLNTHELSARADATLDELLGLDAALYERTAALLPHEDPPVFSIESLLAEAAALTSSPPATSTNSSFVDPALLEQLLRFNDDDSVVEETHSDCVTQESVAPVERSVDTRAAFSSSDSDEQSKTPPPKAAESDIIEKSSKDKPQYNTARKRQVEELKYLRLKVQELEQELETLQEPSQNAVVNCSSSLQLTLSGGSGAANYSALLQVPGLELTSSHQRALNPPASSKLWKRVAKNQQQSRQRAELENARLRETVVSQLKIVKGLEKVLKKRVNTPVREAACILARWWRIAKTHI